MPHLPARSVPVWAEMVLGTGQGGAGRTWSQGSDAQDQGSQMVRGILPLSDSDWGESISPFSSYDICVSQVLESKLQSLLYSTSRIVTLDIGKDTETPQVTSA